MEAASVDLECLVNDHVQGSSLIPAVSVGCEPSIGWGLQRAPEGGKRLYSRLGAR